MFLMLTGMMCLPVLSHNPKEAEKSASPRKVLVLAERGGLHEGFTSAGLEWLEEQKERLHMELTVLNSAKEIPAGELLKYQMVLQLNYPPYAWSKAAQKDMERQHPVMKDVPGSFVVAEDEWYTYETSPRPNVRVLARVDENSYSIKTDIKMGDHPVIWTNPAKKARNVYFQFGHSRSLFRNPAFVQMFENAIRWTLDSEVQEQDGYAANYAREPRFRALVHYEPGAEEAHVQFDKQTIDFFHKLTYGEGWLMDVTTSLADYPYEKLKDYNIIISLNAMPGGKEQREAFQKYMENGGGWMGFHASAYNDRNTHWPWFNEFLGCGMFYCNNWPPQPALVECDVKEHPVTCSLPQSFVAPASEFYQWQPSPRKNPDVEVLLSISPKMYPFGLKDVVRWGDFPIVWTNTKYRMIYLNMGHGDEGFIDATQNLLFVNAFRWVVSRAPNGDPFKK